ncbi:MAG: hypothetical protein Q9220_007301 [cf. Caloplaca sp. 1 TL-2023]
MARPVVVLSAFGNLPDVVSLFYSFLDDSRHKRLKLHRHTTLYLQLLSIIIGDYLYIDGGTVQTRDTNSTYSRTQNATYSLSLATSWESQNVSFTMIEKGGDVQNYNRPNLFLRSDNSSFYAFNGDLGIENTFDRPKAPPELWSFTPDGRGNGAWQFFSVAPSSIRGSAWVGSAVANGSVYLLGGFQWAHSTPGPADGSDNVQSANGLVSYHLDAHTWANQSITYPYPNGWAWDQGLFYLTGLGDHDLLLAMGGMKSRPRAFKSPDDFAPYDVVSVYNTVTKEWRNQTTTGTGIPIGRNAACTFGAPGDNGTFELFLYGGFRGAPSSSQSQENIELGQSVYVLSLPSFTWHKFDYPQQTARAYHTCTPHNSQMLAIGGLSPNIDGVNETKDPWPQGIGILDLNSMEWKDSYDSKAGSYETPKQIKDSIAANGPYPQRWDDDLSRQWIIGDRNSIAPLSPSLSSSKSGHTGAIVGIVGGVVGGIAAISLIAAIPWCLRRRQHRRNAPPPNKQQQAQNGFEKAELENEPTSPRQELSSDPRERWERNGELHGRPLLELDGGRAEMEAPSARFEMDSRGK